jgi:hypothetical protein
VHVLPVSRGGQTTARNLELLCHRCHATRSRATVAHEFGSGNG